MLLGAWAPTPARAFAATGEQDDPDEATLSLPTAPPPATTATAAAAPTSPAPSPSAAPEVPPEPNAQDTTAAGGGELPALSWTMLTGDVPDSGGLLEAQVGMTSMPRVGYHLSVGGGFSIGAVAGFDYGLFTPKAIFDPGFYIAGAFRGSVRLDQTVRLGFRGELGALLAQNRRATFVIDASANIGFDVARDVVLGAGIDMPIGISFAIGGLSWPFLVGPVVEYRLTTPLALTAEAKIGPVFNNPGGVGFGARVMGGLALRL